MESEHCARVPGHSSQGDTEGDSGLIFHQKRSCTCLMTSSHKSKMVMEKRRWWVCRLWALGLKGKMDLGRQRKERRNEANNYLRLFGPLRKSSKRIFKWPINMWKVTREKCTLKWQQDTTIYPLGWLKLKQNDSLHSHFWQGYGATRVLILYWCACKLVYVLGKLFDNIY